MLPQRPVGAKEFAQEYAEQESEAIFSPPAVPQNFETKSKGAVHGIKATSVSTGHFCFFAEIMIECGWSELGRRHFLAATRTRDRTEELIREEIALNAHESFIPLKLGQPGAHDSLQ